jgi:hypothetical protein
MKTTCSGNDMGIARIDKHKKAVYKKLFFIL